MGALDGLVPVSYSRPSLKDGVTEIVQWGIDDGQGTVVKYNREVVPSRESAEQMLVRLRHRFPNGRVVCQVTKIIKYRTTSPWQVPKQCL